MSEKSDPGAIGAGDEVRMARRFGLTAAIASTVFGILYLLGLGVNLATSGSPYPSGADVRVISAGVALAWNVVLLILFASLRGEAGPSEPSWPTWVGCSPFRCVSSVALVGSSG